MDKNQDYCVCCGEPIPEGRWICPNCEKNPSHTYQRDPGKRNKREKKRDRKPDLFRDKDYY